jgi:two-component system, OmpR family, sensor histidine kinase VicK
MQRVPDKYYDWYNNFATISGGLFSILGVVALLVANLSFLESKYGFTPITVFIGIIQLVYGLVFYKRQVVSGGYWNAALLGSMILVTNVLSVIHNSGNITSPFMFFWGFMFLLSGIFGVYGSGGSVFLVTVYYVLFAVDGNNKTLLDVTSLSILAGSILACTLSYFFWKRMFIDEESAKVKQLSQKLGTSQAQAEKLIQSITDGVIVTDTEGTITLLNPAASLMTGWQIQEATGINQSQVIKFQLENGKNIDDSQNPFSQLRATNKPVTTLLRLVKKDNSYITTSVSVSPIFATGDQKIDGVIAVLRDVSEAREEENRRADFISTASHEMRTPVAAIEGYLQLAMNDKVATIDSKARSYMEKALDSTHHLGQLFQDLLTSAKAEDGRLVSHPRVVEIGELLQKTTDDLRFSAEKKGLLLDFKIGASGQEISAGTPGGKVLKPLYYALVDPDRIQEVITNLFDNAVKYTDSGKITVALTGNEEVVQLFIQDTGQGIPKDDIPHLFQKFYRVDNSSTRTIGGTGLGLFICKRIVELYKGRIWVESQQGNGSTFYINLPRLSSQKAVELQQKESQAPTSNG